MPEGQRRVHFPKGTDWRLQPAIAFALLAAAYLFADLALNKLAIGLGWMILWPLNGISIALLLRARRRRWPWLLLAIELGTTLGERLDHHALNEELLERLWSTMEVLLSAWLLPAFLSMEDWLAQPRIVRRVCGALVVGPGLSGVFYAVHVHLQSGTPLVPGWACWGPPDMLGNAVTLPVALACFAPEARQLFSRQQWMRTVLLLGGSLLISVLIFSEGSYPLLFLLYPMLLYIDSRLSFAGSSTAIFAASLIGVFCTVHDHGPFGHWAPGLHLSRGTALQVYLGFHAVALLPLSLVILERKNIAAQLQRANAQLVALSQRDALTGIRNRRAFDQAFAEAWDLSGAEKTPLSVLMIDIDHFKQYNDLYGHVLGDSCLTRVAEVLKRIDDQPEATVARFGGEEFAVLLPGRRAGECVHVAESLRNALWSAGIPHKGNPWGLVTISVGCASTIPAPGGTRLDLLERADAALYEAKRRGRNCWAYSDGPAETAAPVRSASRERRAVPQDHSFYAADLT